MNSPLTVNGLGGTDSVRIVGTIGNDTITVTSAGLTVNGAGLVLSSIEARYFSATHPNIISPTTPEPCGESLRPPTASESFD